MALQLNGTDGVTFNDGSEQWAAASPIGTKNLIINGNMQIAQRGTSSTGQTTSGYKTCDRWYINIDTIGTWSVTQDTDVPTGQGFASSLKMDCTTADASLSASDALLISYRSEGQHLQHLKKGTANAESVTLSFWVKSNKTGTYVAELSDNDNIRHINQTYTINSADTWEKKTITFAGDTTGAFDNDNAVSLYTNFWIGAGTTWTSGTTQTSWTARSNANRAAGLTVNLADSTSNYINITGIQLEVGDTATPFEHRPYDMELARCLRYCIVYGGDNVYDTNLWGSTYSTTTGLVHAIFPTAMRTTPSVSYSSLSDWSAHLPAIVALTVTGISPASDSSKYSMGLIVTHASNGSMGGNKAYNIRANNTTNARLTFSAEL